MERRLGILVLSEPDSPDLETVRGLCRAASEMGVEVEIFFMGDGVYRLEDPELAGMARAGAKVTFCALNATERQLDRRPAYPWGMEEGSQFNLACMVELSDRLIAFT